MDFKLSLHHLISARFNSSDYPPVPSVNGKTGQWTRYTKPITRNIIFVNCPKKAIKFYPSKHRLFTPKGYLFDESGGRQKSERIKETHPAIIRHKINNFEMQQKDLHRISRGFCMVKLTEKG